MLTDEHIEDLMVKARAAVDGGGVEVSGSELAALCEAATTPRPRQVLALGGMMLRDWFAGQAMVGEMTASGNHALPREVTIAQFWQERAEFYYMIADAMLKAREAKP